MYARLVNELPGGKDWLYEVKLDGYRCLAGKGNHQVTLWSRRRNLFTKQFPRIAQVCEQLKPDTLLDGEIVALDKTGGHRSIYFNITDPKHARFITMRLTYLSIVGNPC
jgi:bifunctional non-homologous end joining protein LigD